MVHDLLENLMTYDLIGGLELFFIFFRILGIVTPAEELHHFFGGVSTTEYLSEPVEKVRI